MDAFGSKFWKPRYNYIEEDEEEEEKEKKEEKEERIGSRVGTRRFRAMGHTGFNLYSPTVTGSICRPSVRAMTVA